MKGDDKRRFTDQQIIAVLKRNEAGQKVPELAREIGVTEATIHNWKSKYGGVDVSDVRRLRSLEDENRRLRRLVAELRLDNEALVAIVRKKGWDSP